MKTLSVQEAAQILGISERSVEFRLTSGDLEGTRTCNKRGVDEWRIRPNEQILKMLGVELTEELPANGPAVLKPRGGSDKLEETGEHYTNQVSFLISEVTAQFAAQLSAAKDTIQQLEQTLHQSQLQLQEIPQLKKKLQDSRNEATVKDLEALTLSKQTALIIEKLNAELVESRLELIDTQKRLIEFECEALSSNSDTSDNDAPPIDNVRYLVSERTNLDDDEQNSEVE